MVTSLSVVVIVATMSKAELCPEAMVEVKELACRVREHGGAALVADYGGLGNDRHTLRVSQPLFLPPSPPLPPSLSPPFSREKSPFHCMYKVKRPTCI